MKCLLRNKWLQNLRSGEYQQGKNMLGSDLLNYLQKHPDKFGA